MVYIWTNRYLQGNSYVKNGTTPINDSNYSFIVIKVEDIEVTRVTQSYRKLRVSYFLIL